MKPGSAAISRLFWRELHGTADMRTAARPLSRRRFLAGVAAVGAVGVPSRRGWGGQKQLNVYNWGAYIGETTLETFAKKTGIAVQYDLYSSNDDLIAKFQTGNPGYDV